jgi:hypothetical protein
MTEPALKRARELVVECPHKYIDGPNCGWFNERTGKACGEPPDGKHHIRYGPHTEIAWMHMFEPESIHDPDCPTCKLPAVLDAWAQEARLEEAKWWNGTWGALRKSKQRANRLASLEQRTGRTGK